MTPIGSVSWKAILVEAGEGVGALNDHGAKQAEMIIAAGLEAFGLEEGQLSGMKKSADEKVLIAAIVREVTAVKVAWLAERLEMGSKSNVTRASSTVPARLYSRC